MASGHKRFALREVTFDGVPMPGATVDCWADDRGHPRWSARIVTRSGPLVDEGELAGRTVDGRLVSGHALISNRELNASGRREVLLVFHGSGSLHGLGDLPA